MNYKQRYYYIRREVVHFSCTLILFQPSRAPWLASFSPFTRLQKSGETPGGPAYFLNSQEEKSLEISLYFFFISHQPFPLNKLIEDIHRREL